MGNDEAGAAGRAARGGTETITRPDRAPRPRRERQAPPRQRPPADRRGPESPETTAPDRTAPERARPGRPPAAQEQRRRVPPQGFARPRGPAPDSGARTATPTAPVPATPRVPRAPRVPSAPRPSLAGQAPSAAKAPKAPKVLKAPQALKTPRASPARAAGRMPFLLLVCGLLSGALVSALVISTTLAEGSFQISQLQQQDSVLARQRQALEAQVAQAHSPTVIQQRAYQLGMRPVDVVRFLDLRDGKVKTDARGKAASAAKVPGPTR